MVDASGVTPCYVGDLPEQCAALNRTNINVQLHDHRGRRDPQARRLSIRRPCWIRTLQSELSIDDIVSLCDDLIAGPSGMAAGI